MAVGRVAGGTSPSPSPVRRRPAGAPPRSSGTGRTRLGGAKRRAAGRGPFAALVVLILAGGLIALLMLNTALNQGSFQLSQLQQRTNSLTDERQGLQQQINAWSAPDALAARAQQLGMVPGANNPAFLQDNGTVLGRPSRLDGSAALPTPTAGASASATPSATATPSSTARPTGTATATTTATATAAPTTAGTRTSHATGTVPHAGARLKPAGAAATGPDGATASTTATRSGD